MGYLWIATIILSSYMEITNELRIFKDIADARYKVDLKKLSELSQHMTKPNLLLFLIPIINILQAIKNTMKYSKDRPMLLNQLQVMGALKEMSQNEQEEYAKKPTALTAFLISYNYFEEMMDAKSNNNKQNVDLSSLCSKKDEQPSKESTITEQKQELEKLKEELLAEKEKTPEEREKGKTLDKRKK